MFKASVEVTLKPSVLDPQGEAVKKAIHGLGMDCVEAVRIGKLVELEISGDDLAKTEAKLHEVCKDLLSNPVIETYKIQIKKA